jgi:uncharacterized membrane protein YphA (DoxX/SURF4 family)
LGGLFLWSGWEKLNHLDAFYQAAQQYKVLPELLTHFYAAALPWLEILGGVYLILGLFTRAAAWATGAMTLSFMIAITLVLLRGEAVDCGCFVGGKSEPVTWALWARDLALLLGSLYLGWIPGTAPWSVDAYLESD